MSTEARELQVLVVEDSEDDLELLVLELRRGGWKPTYERVETPGALREALARRRWDIVLSDYAMPAFTGLDAFRIVRDAGLDLPFVLVSGTVGEERAVEAVKTGIHDYLLKGQLTRLSASIERELREAVSRRRHAIQSAVTHVLATLRTTAEVTGPLLTAIGVPMGWAEAELWLTGDDGGLVRVATWSPDGSDPTPLTENAGLVERVLASGGPEEAAAPGCAATLGLPIEHGGVPIGAVTGRPGPKTPPAGPLLETLLGVGSQIGECVARQRAEGQLQESEQRYRSLVGSLSVGVVLVDAGLVVRAMNPAAERILGLSAADLVGRAPLPDPACDADGAPLRPEDLPARRILLTGRPVADVVLGFDGPDGARRWVSMNAEPLASPGATAPGRVVVSFTDVTLKRLLEEQLRQAQKMEALGRLAGGVAHDFNNILTTILGFSELLLASLPSGSPMAEDLSEIHKAGERAAALTRQLLSFSRRQAIEPMLLDLNDLTTDLERMLRRLVLGSVEMRLGLEPDLGLVRADRGQLEQVVMNLVVNASDAMPAGGTLTIRSGNVDLEEAWELQHLDLVPGRYVKLSVADTGTGMPPEVLSHVFEPFFTTKGPGKGTGLGLATVYGIVKQSGGLITVESEFGRGTKFTVYLPRVAEGSRDEGDAVGS